MASANERELGPFRTRFRSELSHTPTSARATKSQRGRSRLENMGPVAEAGKLCRIFGDPPLRDYRVLDERGTLQSIRAISS